jgi:ATP adenylyltransferase
MAPCPQLPTLSRPSVEIAMSHEQLWAPWRLGYIAGERTPAPDDARLQWLAGADHDCFMCRAIASLRGEAADSEKLPLTNQSQAGRAHLVVLRGPATFALLNRYPYNNGHLLVVPQRHVGQLADLTDGEHLELQQQITRLTAVLAERMNAEGFNIGLNLGRVAGAGVPGHLHWHIVPRWSGDTNFISSIDSLRVIPQALEAAWEMLSTELAEQ